MEKHTDLFLKEEVYSGGFMLKQELATLYEVSIGTLKRRLRRRGKLDPQKYMAFTSNDKKVSPIEINRIIEAIGPWEKKVS